MVSEPVPFAAGSYRDRGARVFCQQDRILRAMSSRAIDEWRDISRKSFYQELETAGQVVATREITEAEALDVSPPEWAETILEHERVEFVSSPYEWCFSMLRDAALLHLQILSACLPAGVILKDATPYNVQFRGHQPVFIDIGSFVRRNADEPWIAYRQFCELMLIPLLLQAYRGIDFQSLLRADLEGIAAESARRWFSLRDFFRPGVATHVWLHGWMQQSISDGAGSTRRSLESSGFSSELILHNVRRLSRLVDRLRWSPPETAWTAYDSSLPHVAADGDAKRAFVREVCGSQQRNLVWDLGCNQGDFSRIAAQHAKTVVAMDQDHGCIERLYLALKSAGPNNILPLRVDLANPSPAQGWRGRERLRLEARGRPDLVLCLGLIHHLSIGANLPLADIIEWFAELNGELILEYPTKSDSLVRRLLKNKHDQYVDYSLEEVVACLRRHFHIRRCVALPSGERFLFHATQNF